MASERAERVLAGAGHGPEERQRQLVHLPFVHGPQRLDVGHRPEPAEARDVVGVHELEVGEVRARVGPAVLAARGLDGVQPEADGAVAKGVEVGLEPERIEPRHRLR